MEHDALDNLFMERCLSLAMNGMGNTKPNPMVGSVVVHNNRIVGEGYHSIYGGAHAEKNAIESVVDKSVLKDSILYVSLEPCSHFGKTPPCANLIVDSGIRKVVVAVEDPNPLVKGKGIEFLSSQGVEVKIGVKEAEAIELNRRFFTFHTRNRPYVILKWAQTLDGFIDVVRKPDDPVKPVWITNEESRVLVHKWRSEEQAILIGTNTVLMDNPQLNVRYWQGQSPMRVVLDRLLRIPLESHVYDGTVPTLIFIGNNATALARRPLVAQVPNTEMVIIDFARGAEVQMLKELHRRGVQSLIIEGGTMILNSFFARGFWDEARMFVGNKFFGNGVKAPFFKGEPITFDEIGDSRLYTFRNT